MIQCSSKILQPYFKAACEPDWFKPLQALVERTPLSELPGIRQHAEDAAKQCGFCIQGGRDTLPAFTCAAYVRCAIDGCSI